MHRKQLNLLLASFFAICFFLIPHTSVAAGEVPDGVYIDSVNIGGMTIEEAEEAVENYVEDLKNKTITIDIEGENEQITLTELGFSYKDNNFIEESTSIGSYGNLVKRYKEIKDIAHNDLIFSLEYTIDKNSIRDFVENKISPYNISSENASLKRESGEFIYTDHLVGRHVEVEETVNLIEESIYDDWDKGDIKLSAVILEDQPDFTREMVEKVDSKLGTYTTYYASSSNSRASNISNGARLINNIVLYPGDEFSAYEVLTPFTVANGYSVGGAYENGIVVDSIGGGACQVTTTIYNAALYAEMEVTERQAHSMTVSYVDLARDAAIAGTYKDIKFVNNTDYPILIQGFTQNRSVTFTIWGHETRADNRKIEFETVVLSSRQPPEDVETEDPTKPESYKETTQSPHTGYVAELYKIVYEDGKQVSREKVNKSSYMATPRHVTIGTMPEPEPETEEELELETIDPEGTEEVTDPNGEEPDTGVPATETEGKAVTPPKTTPPQGPPESSKPDD